MTLRDELVASDAPEDPWLSRELARAFPSPLPERYGDAMRAHRLRSEIIATRLTNRLVDRGGIGYALRLHDADGRAGGRHRPGDRIAWEVHAIDALWDDVEAARGRGPRGRLAEVLLEAQRLATRATRWLLLNRPRPLDVAPAVEALGEDVRTVSGMLPALLHGAGREAFEERVAAWTSQGLPEALARRGAGLQPLAAALDVADVAAATASPIGWRRACTGCSASGCHSTGSTRSSRARGRNNRWEVQARTSLRDDLYVVRRTLTERVLREGEGDDPAELVDAWLAARAEAVARVRELLADVRAAGARDPAAQAVAVREVSALAEPSARGRRRSGRRRRASSRMRRIGSGSPRRPSPRRSDGAPIRT